MRASNGLESTHLNQATAAPCSGRLHLLHSRDRQHASAMSGMRANHDCKTLGLRSVASIKFFVGGHGFPGTRPGHADPPEARCISKHWNLTLGSGCPAMATDAVGCGMVRGIRVSSDTAPIDTFYQLPATFGTPFPDQNHQNVARIRCLEISHSHPATHPCTGPAASLQANQSPDGLP